MSSTIDHVVLRGGSSSLTLSAALGGKISSLHVAGREWLWTSDIIPRRVPDDAMREDDASYVELADTGGFDECFPTVGPCSLPGNVQGYAGLRLPDHGELWSQEPAVETHHGADGGYATVTWKGRRMPYTFVRTAHVSNDGRVKMHYSATNHGSDPLPFLWSAHPLLPLTDRTHLHLPTGTRLRVDAAHGFSSKESDGQSWPILLVNGSGVDVSTPASLGDGRACKLFLDLPRGPLRASVEEGGARLDVELNGDDVSHFGVWINNRGWTPFQNGRPYRNLAFEPCIGAPDSLARSIERWNSAAWLAPGETREWTLTWSGSRA